MSGSVASVVCPNGHSSADSAICSVCGVLIPPPLIPRVDSAPTAGRSVLPVPGPAAPLRPIGAIDPGRDAHANGEASVPSAVLRPAAGSASASASAPPSAQGWVCPNCSADLEAGSRFCEVCGYDPTTGSLPGVHAHVVRPAAAPAPTTTTTSSVQSTPAFAAAPSAPSGTVPTGPTGPTGRATVRLVAVITADRDYYDSHEIDEVQFPLGVPPRTILMADSPVNIGRRSRSRGTNPEIDLAGPPEDPAVSAVHASLLPTDEGSWVLVDHGSTNGTYLNESVNPVPANRPLPITAGDRVYVGAWTRITLERG